MRLWATALALAASTAGHAQVERAVPSTVVVGTGSVRTPPDLAVVGFDVRGEGATPDAATAALATAARRVVEGVRSLSPDGAELRSGDVSIRATRSQECKADEDDDAPRLSTGPCAIRGYVATQSATVRVVAVTQGGTAVGLAGRLGAEAASIESFGLRSAADAQRRANVAAMLDARQRAEAIAGAAGARLGPILSVRDEDARSLADDIIVTGEHSAAPVVAPPPIVVAIAPAPIETTARLTVSFAIER